MATTILAAGSISTAFAQEMQAPQSPPLPQQIVYFKSLDATTELTAYLSRPEGDQPRPALVLMHGCSGLLNDKGIAFGTYRAWTRALLRRDYVAGRRQRRLARLRSDLFGGSKSSRYVA